MSTLKRGDAFRYFDLTIIVTRVAKAGGWADVRVTQSNGVGWSKRIPLPIPASWLPAVTRWEPITKEDTDA